MKKGISILFSWIVKLWRTLVLYVRRKRVIRSQDVDNDGKEEIIIDLNGCNDIADQNNNILEDDYDK